MKISSAIFLTGAVTSKQYPRDTCPEFAFAGRSNVGKSSLINSLLNRKKLVKTSSTPGKTQMLNFFKVNDQLIFVDLPGYGFAKVPFAVKKRWQNMIEEYLLTRKTLVCVVLIVDMRRTPVELDIELKNWLDVSGIDHIVVATKLDKINQNERAGRLRLLRDTFADGKKDAVIAYSSKNHAGRVELWGALMKKMEAKMIGQKAV